MIEDGEGADELLWHRIGDVAVAPVGTASDGAPSERGLAVAKWHELIADTISLMSDRVAPGDPRAAGIAQRYRRLEEAQSGSLGQMFILAENVTPHHGASGSFDVLRDSVEKYLEDVKEAHPAPPRGDGE